MKCERCNIEMEKKEIYMRLGYEKPVKTPFGGSTEKPISAHSAYICPECGKIELNINE